MSKQPSSLDYDAHLHELALRNWRRALAAHDVARAEANAQKLVVSHDKLWRFIGCIHLALANLGGGRPSLALDALAAASRAYPEARRLVNVAKTHAAHVHLETRSPQQALDVLRETVPTSETAYWRALACARLGRRDEARELASTLEDAPMAAHLKFELEGDLDALGRTVEHVPDEELASPKLWTPIRFAFGDALRHRRQYDDAAEVFVRIASMADVILYWPVPYVRSLFHVGWWHARRGGDGADEMYRAFLRLWEEGELDRSAVEKARQFVNA